MDEPKPPEPSTKHWSRIIGATGSPLKLFALVVLVCCSVFAVAAGVLGDPDTFVFCIHMFLAIVGAFVLTALWSPRSLYHPNELLEIRRQHQDAEDREIFPVARPWVPTLVIALGAVLYGAYQFATAHLETDKEASVSFFDLIAKLF